MGEDGQPGTAQLGAGTEGASITGPTSGKGAWISPARGQQALPGSREGRARRKAWGLRLAPPGSSEKPGGSGCRACHLALVVGKGKRRQRKPQGWQIKSSHTASKVLPERPPAIPWGQDCAGSLQTSACLRRRAALTGGWPAWEGDLHGRAAHRGGWPTGEGGRHRRAACRLQEPAGSWPGSACL